MAKHFDTNTLFTYLRRAPFGGRLTQQQVDGVNVILQAWGTYGLGSNIAFLAYILATAFHETGGRMEPVREKGGSKYLAKYDTGKLAKQLGNTPEADGDGQKYAGRGYVQLTGAANYKKTGRLIGTDLFHHPDLALDPYVSARILICGMIGGWFTGKRLSEYFDGAKCDAVGARRIVNGADKAHLIAGHFEQFRSALEAADTLTALPADASIEEATPDGTSLAKDKSTLGVAILGSGGFASTLIASINNPWAAIVAVVIVIGAFLYFTGRLEIRRKAGA